MPEKKGQERNVLDKLGIKPGSAVSFAHEAREVEADLCQLVNERAGRFPGLG